MRPQKTVFYFLHGLWTLVFVACVFSSAAHAADLQIVQGEDAYVGQEIVLSLQGSLLSQKPLFEWSVSGDVKSVLLKNRVRVHPDQHLRHRYRGRRQES